MKWLKQCCEIRVPYWLVGVLVLVALTAFGINAWGVVELSLSPYLLTAAILTVLGLTAIGYILLHFFRKAEIVAFARVGLLINFILLLVFPISLLILASLFFEQWWTFISQEDSLQHVDWSGTAAFIVAVLSLPAGIVYWLGQDKVDKAISLFLGLSIPTADNSKVFADPPPSKSPAKLEPVPSKPTDDAGGK